MVRRCWWFGLVSAILFNDVAQTLTFRFFDAAGRQIEQRTVAAPARTSAQISNAFEAIGIRTDVPAAYCIVSGDRRASPLRLRRGDRQPPPGPRLRQTGERSVAVDSRLELSTTLPTLGVGKKFISDSLPCQ